MRLIDTHRLLFVGGCGDVSKKTWGGQKQDNQISLHTWKAQGGLAYRHAISA
jgi:hypothetical protein